MTTNPPPATAEEPAWHAAYPPPRNATSSSITRAELLQHLNAGQRSGVDFLLVDLRRTDFEGGTIRGALNLPAQSLYESLETLYNICHAAGIDRVIWWCGSSRGRGTRAAGWFDDLLADKGDERMKSLILEGGIKGWVVGGGEYQAHMVGFEEGVWKR